MAFPAGPYTDGQTHTEFGVGFTYSAAAAAWLKDPPPSGGGTITVIGGNVPQTRTVTGALSVTGGGDLTADRTLSLVNDASPSGLFYYGTNAAGVKGWYSIQPTQSSRNVLTANSVTGGGNLTADRTLQLVGDVATPADNMFYGTNASGVRGWVQQGANVPAARSITGTNSITGGGDLTADRTLSLVNDAATPGNSKMYGTNAAGVKGWYDAPKPPVWCSGITMIAPQTVAFAGYFQWNMTNNGILSTNDASNGTQIPLLAGSTYNIEASVINGNGSPIKFKIVDRTNGNATLISATGFGTMIYTPTANINIAFQSDEASSISNPSGALTVIGV